MGKGKGKKTASQKTGEDMKSTKTSAEDVEMGDFEDVWDEEKDIIEMNDESDTEMVLSENDDNYDGNDNEDDEDKEDGDVQVYLPGQPLAEGEVLDYDSRAYEMLHQLDVEWPSLSFDIIRDNLGDCREQYPMTCYFVTGTQAEKSNLNKLSVVKVESLCKTKHDEDDSDASDSDDDDLDDDPVIRTREVKKVNGSNRVRCMNLLNDYQDYVVASMNDDASLSVYSIKDALNSLAVADGHQDKQYASPSLLWTGKGHREEGYALDWSLVDTGRLLSGDNSGFIYETRITRGNESRIVTMNEKSPFKGHTASVEDIQWSPSESNIFASCSVDGTVRLWDTRIDPSSASVSCLKLSETDINVISWNRKVNYLFAAGMDDGTFQVLDLRMISSPAKANSISPSSCHPQVVHPIANFSWHKGPITSLEWHPWDESVLAVSGADDQLTIWDLSLERDEEAMDKSTLVGDGGIDADIPPQLLCIHQGQQDMKELHFHPQLKNVIISTAISGFHIFKSVSLLEQ